MNPRQPIQCRPVRAWFPRLLATCLALAAFWPSRLQARPVTFQFRGIVSGVQADRTYPGFPAGVTLPAVGSDFSGTYTFDSDARDTNSAPSQGLYTTPAPNGPVRVNFGAFRWDAGGSFVSTTESDAPGAPDTYEAGSGPGLGLVSHPELAGFFNRNNFSLKLTAEDPLLDGPALPTVPPRLDFGALKMVTLWADNGANTRPTPVVAITGTLTSLTLVPEPGAAGASCAAAASLLLSRRRRRV